jgi:hypothetical protein
VTKCLSHRNSLSAPICGAADCPGHAPGQSPRFDRGRHRDRQDRYLATLAEAFSDAGVAVFAADIKGDLCGLGAAGNPQGKVAERIAGMPWLTTSRRPIR